MTKQKTAATLRIERTMKAPAERIYKAYLDPTSSAKALSPGGSKTVYEQLDATVGGAFRYTMTMPGGGWSQTYAGKFLELNEFTRIRHTYAFVADEPEMATPMEIVLSLREEDGTTQVVFEQFGIPAPIPKDKAKAGWQEFIDGLARIVERS